MKTATAPLPPLRSVKVLDQLRERIRYLHYSLRTEQAYVHWVRAFIRFHGVRHPATLGSSEVEAFLSWLANERKVSVSTHRQALAALRVAEGKALPFRAAKDGESVSGKFTGTVQLTSGKFAIVEKSHEFTLVPWRPIIDRQLGREVAGIMQGGSVSWQLGRQRGLGL